METSTDCPERRRLTQNVEDAIAAVDTVKNSRYPKTFELLALLNEARIAQRIAERALRDHIKQHGCMAPKS
jgi:hypothetical protein